MHDELGERMKSQYEQRTRYSLPRRSYTIIRIDGKAFHTYTRGCQKPFDKDLIADMDETAKCLCKEIQGAQFAYVQSDEISILLTDFATPNTDAWFDGNVQKIVSVSASLATAQFNLLRAQRHIDHKSHNLLIGELKIAHFDARVFTIPDRTEVANYFIWRNNDAARNSISMVAHSLYSNKELHGKSCNEMQEMIFQKGINWADYDMSLKNGRLITKEKIFAQGDSCIFGGTWHGGEGFHRTQWNVSSAWIFTKDQESLYRLIPTYS